MVSYENIRPAKFLYRPNRFIAHILVDEKEEICHVKNTGRCRELLLPGADILVQECDFEHRKTKYDLISVYKGRRLINMDSAVPNKIFAEWVQQGGLGFYPELIKPEYTYGDSRFDFYLQNGKQGIFVEIKGVTLEENNIVRFPDAPTLRGVKHLHGLIDCCSKGYEAYAVFIIQMADVLHLAPNWNTHREFAQALAAAQKAGVKLLALDCLVNENSICARREVPIILEEQP